MRKILFKICWHLHLRTLAYNVSPSLFFIYAWRNFSKDFVRGMNDFTEEAQRCSKTLNDLTLSLKDDK